MKQIQGNSEQIQKARKQLSSFALDNEYLENEISEKGVILDSISQPDNSTILNQDSLYEGNNTLITNVSVDRDEFMTNPALIRLKKQKDALLKSLNS